MTAILASQAVTLLAQLAYVFAFRATYLRQAETLRQRAWASLGLGAAACGAAALAILAALHLAAADHSAALLILLSAPLYLAIAAGSAVCLGVLSAAALRWDLQAHPYRCLLAGQALAVLLQAVPRAGPLLATSYAAAGIGAIGLAEWSASREEGCPPRLGYAGLAAMLALAAALAFGLIRAGSRLGEEAAHLALPGGPQPLDVPRR